MSEYREFADSILSPLIWQNEGVPFLISYLLIFFFLIAAYVYGRRTKKGKWEYRSFSTIMILGSVTLVIAIFSPLIVEGFNQNVADHNIGVKYDDSKISISYHSMGSNTVYAQYTDGASQINDPIKFVFDKNSVEPFIFQSTGSAENFKKITEAISKAR